MSALHAAVLSAFKNQGWAYREVKGVEVVEADFEAYHTKVPLHVQSFGEAHIISVVANASRTVPSTHRYRTAELLMRANRDLNLGNFEMDWDQGAVMFRQSQVFPKHRYDESIVAGLIHNAVAEMDRLTPFLGVLIQKSAATLAMVDMRELLQREDLLPPVQTEPEAAPSPSA